MRSHSAPAPRPFPSTPSFAARLAAALALAACSSSTTESTATGGGSRLDAPAFNADFDAEAPTRLANAWADWKASWVTTAGAGDGARVLFQEGEGKPGDTSQGTVSEGIGYGMLLSVYFDDRSLFDGLNRYFEAHKNGNGLMGWKVRSDGAFDASVGGSGSATDADEDIAAALLLAGAKWSRDDYTQEGAALAKTILALDIDTVGTQGAPTFLVLGGDWDGPGNAIDFNASYFAPAWYRLFQSATGDTRWTNVIDAGYALVAKIADPSTGLVPQGVNADGSIYAGQDTYQYDSVRVPFRLAVDQAWFGEPRARERVAAIASFYARAINTDHSDLYGTRVYATRKTDGTVLGAYESGTFTATACVALLQSGDAANGRYLYDALWTEPGRADDMKSYYYDGAWHLFGALFASGNFPNVTGGGAVTPSPTPTPVPPAEPSFTVSASASPNPVEAGQPTTITVSVASRGASLPSALVDVELYDASGKQVAQQWQTPVSLLDGTDPSFAFRVNAPGAVGSYAIAVGVFAADWSKNYVYVQGGTLTVSRGP